MFATVIHVIIINDPSMKPSAHASKTSPSGLVGLCDGSAGPLSRLKRVSDGTGLIVVVFGRVLQPQTFGKIGGSFCPADYRRDILDRAYVFGFASMTPRERSRDGRRYDKNLANVGDQGEKHTVVS